MSFAFTPERQERFQALLARYPDKRSVTLPALHLAQEQEGYLSGETIVALARLLSIVPADLMDTVSFYTMFHTKPKGKYLLQVCQTLSCSLAGADQLVDHLNEKYEIKAGETTTDGRFTLVKVECLGSCGTAPVLQINDDYYERLSLPKVDRILGKLR
ncbi:MAG: NAD(P)H-dependent oxidoreductase subunit E [Candidatus Marinimicrobia bacterium]|nr:NAD(P)H-dependent oxidoreductase subunit E [Candidatus Neomarinimicrobiota bacterium]